MSTPLPSPQHDTDSALTAQAFHVIGAGVAGLSVALVLSRSGYACTVYERREASAFAGMGFLLMPNGYDALRALLGVEGAHELGLEVDELTLIQRDTSARYTTSGSGQRAVYRPQLMARLKRACIEAGVTLLHDISLTRCVPSLSDDGEDELTLTFQAESGERWTRRARFVIAADGVRSTIRGALFPSAELSTPKLTELVGLSPRQEVSAPAVQLTKLHDHERALAFGWMPISEELLIWYAQMSSDSPVPSEDGAARKAFLLDRYQGWPQEVIDVIETCSFERTYRWDTCDLPPLEPCFRSGALLIGDAAHASLPISSQGVSSALEDVVTLQRLLKGLPHSPAQLTPARWAELCAELQRARAPVWRARHQEARELEALFLSGQPFSAVPTGSA